ncbi:MAG: tRNA-dihydrouridine synthase family protein [Christensenellaceae bacterium]|jgi:nifR3 family TIM-barrel protein|nr:tRNA-dihydrouridine synthase family protein [Christensenellaceae bacterium]
MFLFDKDNKKNLIFPAVAGYGDFFLRAECLKYGAKLAFCEMLSAKGLVYGCENTFELLYCESTKNIGVQIFGSDPSIIKDAIQFDCVKKFDTIELNAGCPVRKIVTNGEGSALMKSPQLLYDIVKGMKSVADGRAVGVKMRAGFNQNEKNAVECALKCEEAGADYVTVHGRTADMLYSGFSDNSAIMEVKKAVKIPVIANGDIVDLGTFNKIAEETQADGFAIARAAVARPNIFATLLGKNTEIDIKYLLTEHFAKLEAAFGERTALGLIKGHINYNLKGLPNVKDIKVAALLAKNKNELLKALKQINYVTHI